MPADPPRTDGRVRRGADNRRKIVAAFIAFIREGKLAPTAEDIAARADVGLRTVFRHFDDMERLYGEIAVVIGRQHVEVVVQVIDVPPGSEQVEQAVAFMEAPLRLAAGAHPAGEAARHLGD